MRQIISISAACNEKTPIRRLGLDRARGMCQGLVLTGLSHPKASLTIALYTKRYKNKPSDPFQSSRPFWFVGAGQKAFQDNPLRKHPLKPGGKTGVVSLGGQDAQGCHTDRIGPMQCVCPDSIAGNGNIEAISPDDLGALCRVLLEGMKWQK